MALAIGSRIAAYHITSLLGEGGMGQVYRAHDPKLDRSVAIKILPDAFAEDPERLARFQREAKTLAALNHPNIAIIHGFEEAAGIQALVMELVEGPTLADRIAQGPIPLDETLPIARQIAEALEGAHEQGIIHRDLKPANIKVRDDGMVKVLDFGLAKPGSRRSSPDNPGRAAADATGAATITSPALMTLQGMILGTAAYMSPEQARGKPVDRRADIWAFGVVLFEMLAGHRPFESSPSKDDDDGVSDVLAGILKSEPRWEALPRDTPPSLRRLLRRCLQKEQQQRLQHIGDARFDLEEARHPASDQRDTRLSGGQRIAWAAGAGLVALVAVVAGRWSAPAPAPPPETRVDITTPATPAPTSFALSPDGRKIVYSAMGPRGMQLWLRSLDNAATRPLPGTDEATFPFWSPDSRSIGFFASRKLRVMEVDGGRAQPIADVLTPAGGTWNRAGEILYVPSDAGGLRRVSAGGGASREVTPARTPRLATRSPTFLPDDQHFLFYVARGGEPPGVYVGALGSDAITRLVAADGPAQYVSGHLLFVRDNTLYAQPFNPETRVVSGTIVSVAENVSTLSAGGAISLNVSTSAAGHIAYRAGPAEPPRRLTWFDRKGQILGVIGEPGQRIGQMALSPDGAMLAMQVTTESPDIWMIDLSRNIPTKVTNTPELEAHPLWSPDSRRLLIYSPAGAFITRPGTTDNERLPLSGKDGAQVLEDWSADGRFVLLRRLDRTADTFDIWVLSLEGERKTTPVVQTPANERDGQFSPDGKWVAYQSDESGNAEIYVQAFRGGARQRVSSAGGAQVRWGRDGRELFYVAPDNRLMAVAVSQQEGKLSLGTPAALFTTRIFRLTTEVTRQRYALAPDGQRFLIDTVEEGAPEPITLVLNWKPMRQP